MCHLRCMYFGLSWRKERKRNIALLSEHVIPMYVNRNSIIRGSCSSGYIYFLHESVKAREREKKKRERERESKVRANESGWKSNVRVENSGTDKARSGRGSLPSCVLPATLVARGDWYNARSSEANVVPQHVQRSIYTQNSTYGHISYSYTLCHALSLYQ